MFLCSCILYKDILENCVTMVTVFMNIFTIIMKVSVMCLTIYKHKLLTNYSLYKLKLYMNLFITTNVYTILISLQTSVNM